MINEESTYNKMGFIHDNDNEVYSEDVYYVIRIGQEIEGKWIHLGEITMPKLFVTLLKRVFSESNNLLPLGAKSFPPE